MLRRLYARTMALAATPHAEKALGVISFTESSVFPVPADVLFVPMVLARPEKAWRLAFLASLTSVLGGVFGWMIGHYAFEMLARPALEFYGKMAAFESLRVATGEGTILLLLLTSGAAHLPPMKVVTILSGVVSFPLPWFILSAIVARAGRFYLLAWALRKWGVEVTAFIERRFTLAVVALLGLLALLWIALRLT